MSDPADMGRFYGTEILRAPGLGVWAPITEAGRMRGVQVWNDEVVSYEIGHSPTGLAVDLAEGVSVDATEILSETPSGGGGGSTTAATVIYQQSDSTTVPTNTWTQVVPNVEELQTNASIITYDGSGGVTVLSKGVYVIMAACQLLTTAAPSNAILSIYQNESDLFDFGENYVTEGNAIRLAVSATWHFEVDDVITIRAYQDSGASIATQTQYSVTLYEILT